MNESEPTREKLLAEIARLRAEVAELQTKQAASGHEEHYQSLIENLPVGLVIHAADTLLFVNPAAARILGVASPAELIGRSIWDFVPEHTRDISRTRLHRLYEERQPTPQVPLEIVGLDGRIIPVEMHSIPMVLDGRPAAQTVFQDITDRKRAEDALQASEARFRHLYSSVQAGVVVQAPDGTIIHVNDVASEIFKLPINDVLASTSFDPRWQMTLEDGTPVAGDEHPSMITVRTGQPIHNAVRGIFSDDPDRLRWLLINTEPVFDEVTGDLQEVIITFNDITAQKEAERQLRAERDFSNRMIQTAQVIVLVLDTEGRIVRFNPYMEKLSGYRLAEVQGKDWFSTFLPTRDHDALRALFKRIVNNFPPDGAINPIMTGAGDERLIEWHSTTLRDENDVVVGVLSVGVDVTERQQAEMALARERDMLARLMQTGPVGITIVNQAGQITFANSYAENTLGLSRESITQLAYNAPDWRITALDGGPFPEHELPFRQVTETLKPVFGIQHAIEWPDGRRVLLSINASPILDLAGEFDGMIAVVEDITERQRAEDALRESQERYQILFDTMLDAYALHEMIFDEAGTPVDYRFLDINPAFQRMTGLNRDIIGRTIREVLPDVEAHWLETYGRVVLTGEPVRFENWTGGVDAKWFEVVAFRPKEGHFAAIFQDITDRKRAEAAEREQRTLATALVTTAEIINSTLDFDEVLQLILDVIIDVVPHDGANIMLIDEAGTGVRVVRCCDCYVSKGLENPKTGITWPLARLSHLQYMIEHQTALVIADTADYAGWADSPVQTLIRSYTGAPIVIDGQVIGFLNLDSITPGFFDTHHAEYLRGFANQAAIAIQNAQMFQRLSSYSEDLERAVRARTAELMNVNAELIRLSRIKDEFVSNVSHELKSPITSLMLRHHLIRRTPARLSEHLNVLERETARLNRTIEDLLRLSRLDQGRVEVVRQPLDLNIVVENLVHDRMLAAQQKELVLTFDGRDNLPLVMADQGLIEQVLSILVTNAIHYTLPGGCVTVCTQTVQQGADTWAGFSVADTGLGILPDEQPHLFERFFQGTAHHQVKVSGTGLGLAIAKEIIDRHQGRIDVESGGIPGEGTIFTVWLPVTGEAYGVHTAGG